MDLVPKEINYLYGEITKISVIRNHLKSADRKFNVCYFARFMGIFCAPSWQIQCQ